MSERFALVDAAGNLTGQGVSPVEEKGQLLGYVQIFICNAQGELLVGQRDSKRRNRPNLLDIACAGHVNVDETYDQAAARELMEEYQLATSLQYMFSMSGPYGHAKIYRTEVSCLPQHDPAEMQRVEFRSLEDLVLLRDKFPYLASASFWQSFELYLKWSQNNA